MIMGRKRWVTCGSLALILVLLMVAIPAFLYFRPLGPSLTLHPPAYAAEENDVLAANQPSVQVQPAKTMENVQIQSAQASSTSTPMASEATIQKGMCGGAGKTNLLLLGESLPASAPHGADAIRLVVVDYDQPTVRILTMPPELLVRTSLLENVKGATLTKAYWYGKQPPSNGEPAAVRNATRVVAQALLDNFGYQTQKYLTLKEEVFFTMVDTLGGVEVNVPEFVDGSPEGYGVYEAGPQVMTGKRALDYVRMLQPAGQPPNEWARFARQNQVIYGIQAEILKPKNWLRIPALINDFYHFLFTDLSPKEMLSLNCMIQKVGGNVIILEVTPEMVTIGSDGVMIPDVDAITQLVDSLQNGPK
jgi:anionic cell wall polymer biosynthesis LytR-Cps2A-Psr (LCP) family protein